MSKRKPLTVAESGPTSACHHHYLAAISLNNTAVALLEKHCYGQALETFSDAVATLEVVDTEEDSVSDNAAAKLRRAARCLANPQIMQSADMDYMDVHAYSDLDDVRGIPLSSLLLNSNATTTFPIRIDSVDVTSPITRYDLKLKALVLVRNCSVAYQCMVAAGTSTSEQTTAWADRWNALALNMLRAVHTALVCFARDQSPKGQGGGGRGGPIRGDEAVAATAAYGGFALLGALVLRDLCLLSSLLGETAEALAYHNQLLVFMHRMFASGCFLTCRCAGAA